ncbi:hypothetical protein HMPREF7215_2730 [Pyramidobacter piscolens W5455]|uniref:Uncharacterized protein n=1 Tax=Pyramidobacter piscolens W5455 TaxID=352165 RepID=A0ABM9ZSJ9_9BACT|nr:hypothetical protein HMPREF7215_2730 [Pyramidobacter piscolens W5455]
MKTAIFGDQRRKRKAGTILILTFQMTFVPVFHGTRSCVLCSSLRRFSPH